MSIQKLQKSMLFILLLLLVMLLGICMLIVLVQAQSNFNSFVAGINALSKPAHASFGIVALS
jgi:Tfp pilus assembly protein PilN